MSGVPIVIIGKVKDNDTGEEENVTITGIAGLAGYAPGHPLPPIPGTPPGIWGGANEPFPTPPIALPGLPGWEPPKPGEPPKEVLFDWKIGWTPDTGWVVVAIPKFDVPAPSK